VLIDGEDVTRWLPTPVSAGPVDGAEGRSVFPSLTVRGGNSEAHASVTDRPVLMP